MKADNVTQRERTALAVLERTQRRLKRLTNPIFVVAMVAAGSTMLLALSLLFGLFGDGPSLWHIALAIAATIMVTLFPLVCYIERIEKALSEQIEEISR